ncbi:MAG: nuclear transport factor 2 family protein [Actinobacteria bacterium]|nr:nuclear transport factor 2 family protein [Actinomycetota bacterium]
MGDGQNDEAVRRLFELFEARRWEEAGELLAEDVVVDWPHTRERIRGRENYLGLNRNYPEGWSIDIRRVLPFGDLVVAELRVTLGSEVSHAACFYEMEGGRIARGVEYWIDEGWQDPPQWRARWVEPIPPSGRPSA